MKLPTLFTSILIGAWSGALALGQTNWFLRPSNTTQNLQTVGYGGGRFIACGYGIALNSTNGMSWTGYNLGSTSVTSLAYCDGVWCGVGSFGGGNFGISTNDGRAWTGRSIAGISPNAIAYGAGTLVAVGDSGVIRYSTDGGLTWNAGLSPASYSLYAVTYGNGTWLAAGGMATTVVTSSDGQLWTLRSLPSGYQVYSYSVGYGAGTFVFSAGDYYFTSMNAGVSWNLGSQTNQYALFGPTHVAYGGGIWVAAGPSGFMRLSANAGQNWYLQNSGVTYDLSGVVYGNGMWVAVGASGTIISSQASAGAEPPLVPSVQIRRAVALDWQSQQGAVYQVQYSTNGGAWRTIGSPMLGDGQPKRFYDGTWQDGQRLYRIQIK